MSLIKLFISISFFFFCLNVAPLTAEIIQIDSDFDSKMDQWHHKSKDENITKIENTIKMVMAKWIRLTNMMAMQTHFGGNNTIHQVTWPA